MSRGAQGLRAWLAQRISAVYLGAVTPLLLGYFLFFTPSNHQQWSQFVAQPLVAICLALYVLALLMHAWVGVRDVLIDYVHPLSIRLTLLASIAFLLLGCGLWALRSLMLASALIPV